MKYEKPKKSHIENIDDFLYLVRENYKIQEDRHDPNFDAITPFECCIKQINTKKRSFFKPELEAMFLYHVARGFAFLMSDYEMSRKKKERQFDIAIEKLISVATKSPEILHDKSLRVINIQNPFYDLFKWDERNISENTFASSFLSLLLIVRNRHWLLGHVHMESEMRNIPLVLSWYFSNVKGGRARSAKINFTQLIVFLSQYFFGEVRFAILVDFMNHSVVLSKIFPNNKEVIISKDDLTAALTSLKKQKKTWPASV